MPLKGWSESVGKPRFIGVCRVIGGENAIGADQIRIGMAIRSKCLLNPCASHKD
jgi:hypothetical protein